jgi:hypothetical protein
LIKKENTIMDMPYHREQVYQRTAEWTPELPFVRLTEVLTDGDTYWRMMNLDGRLWDDASEDEKAEFSAWIADLHAAHLRLEVEPAAVRAEAAYLLMKRRDRGDEYDADLIETAIHEARREIREAA